MNLRNKTNQWVENRLITKEQQKEILKHEDKRFLPFVLMSFLWVGILCFIIGVVSFIHTYWLVIPTTVKVLFFILFSVFLVGLIFHSVKNRKKTLLETTLFVSFLMIGGGIGLCAQIFNLPLESHNGLFLWAVFSFVVVYFSKKEYLFLLWIPLFLGGLLGFLKLELLLLFFEQSPLFSTVFLACILLLIIYFCKNFKNRYATSCYKWAIALYIGVLFLGDNAVKNIFEGFLLFLFFMLIVLSLSIKERRVFLFNIISFFIVLRLIFLYIQLWGNSHLTGVGFLTLGSCILILCTTWYFLEKKMLSK